MSTAVRKPPLERYEFFQSDDLDFTREMVGRILRPHRIDLAGRERRLDALVRTCRLGDVSVNYVSYGNEVEIEPGPPDIFFVAQILLSGVSEVHSGASVFLSTPALAAVTSPTEHLKMRLSRDCTRLIVRIERPALEAMLRDLLGHPLRKPLVLEPYLDVAHGAGLRWRHTVQALVSELERPGTMIHDHPAFADSFIQQLQMGLLSAVRHNFSDELQVTPRPESARMVDLAIGLMEAHPEWPHSARSVARQLGTNSRSLERGFQDHRDTSFERYLADIRYRRVHNILHASDPEQITVGDAVVASGLVPTQGFFAEYQRRFGEDPARTLRH